MIATGCKKLANCDASEVLAKFKFYEAKNQVGAQIFSTF